MDITREEFAAYEEVRVSGVTNMWMTSVVSELSGLDQDTIRYIINHYSELAEQYPDVRH